MLVICICAISDINHEILRVNHFKKINNNKSNNRSASYLWCQLPLCNDSHNKRQQQPSLNPNSHAHAHAHTQAQVHVPASASATALSI